MFEFTALNAGAWIITAFFVIGGIGNAVAPNVANDYVRWGYPRWFNFVTCVLELAAAALILLPHTRVFGAALGACIMLAAVATVVRAGQYKAAIPATIVFGCCVALAILSR